MDNIRKLFYQLQSLGFSHLDEHIIRCLPSNNNIIPIFYKYAGMGWLKILVKGRTPNSYKIVPFGGSNGFDQADNIENYKQLDENVKYYSLAEIIRNEKDYDERISSISE